MLVHVQFPYIIVTEDPRDFDYIHKHMQKAFPNNLLKIEEIGVNDILYYGILYLDNQNEEPDFINLKQSIYNKCVL